MKQEHQDWLWELTNTPTAAGREGRIIAFVRAWATEREDVTLESDAFGNLLLSLQRAKVSDPPAPLIYTAHMDHPSFVVTRIHEKRKLKAEFRGYVLDSFFEGSGVLLHHEGHPPQRGRIIELIASNGDDHDQDKTVIAEFERDITGLPGDVMMWDVGPSRIEDDRIYVPACDDVAAVAAALSALDEIRQFERRSLPDVRVLLTRAEEIGFVGALAACQSGLIPQGSRLINLENSKSFADSPIGGGPIIRVGDKTSTFDPDLTYRLTEVATKLAREDPTFRFQRKLMPGGTCEASAFVAFGYAATGFCLPLGNYHNMNDQTGKIGPESISLGDYENMIRLLVHLARAIDEKSSSPTLRTRLEKLLARRKHIVEAPAD